jgi:hypothetical protein
VTSEEGTKQMQNALKQITKLFAGLSPRHLLITVSPISEIREGSITPTLKLRLIIEQRMPIHHRFPKEEEISKIRPFYSIT